MIEQKSGTCIFKGIVYPMPSISIDINIPGVTAFHPPTQETRVFKTQKQVPSDWLCIGEVKRLPWHCRIYNWLNSIYAWLFSFLSKIWF